MLLTSSFRIPASSFQTAVLLLFVDGLGIGQRTPDNPLHELAEAASPLAIFEDEEPLLPLDGRLQRTDACLGVEGRPQSASGQTMILTGINAPALLGRHKQGYPNRELREVIREHSVFRQLQQRGVTSLAFANAYMPRFFNERPRWVSATTVAIEAANMPFRTLDDLRAGQALFHDFTNKVLVAAGYDVPTRTPDMAAEILARIVAAHQFTLYEYFLLDRIGHSQDMAAALTALADLARFVRAVLSQVDLERTTVILTSDHGNIEDLSLRNHTRNAVPTMVWGTGRYMIADRVRTLVDVTPIIIEALTGRATQPEMLA